jgi:hypothetical protein
MSEVLADVEARESGETAESGGDGKEGKASERLQMCNPPFAHAVRHAAHAHARTHASCQQLCSHARLR